jgi:hypothetical protein
LPALDANDCGAPNLAIHHRGAKETAAPAPRRPPVLTEGVFVVNLRPTPGTNRIRRKVENHMEATTIACRHCGRPLKLRRT